MGGIIVPSETPPPPAPKTAETIRTQKLRDKLHTWVYALVDRLEKKTAAGPNEILFVRDGKAEIRITLTTVTSQVLEKLRQSGLEVVAEKANVVIGRIAIEKLAALVEMDEVKLVMPLS